MSTEPVTWITHKGLSHQTSGNESRFGMRVEVVEAGADLSLKSGRREAWVRAVSFPDEVGEAVSGRRRIPDVVLAQLSGADKARLEDYNPEVQDFHSGPVVDEDDVPHGSVEDWWILVRKADH